MTVPPVLREFRPRGHIDEAALRQTLFQIREAVHQNAGGRYVLDCRDVTGFCGHALVELARTIEDVRRHGGTVALTNCPPGLMDRVPESLLTALLDPATIEKLRDFLEKARDLIEEHAGGYQDYRNN